VWPTANDREPDGRWLEEGAPRLIDNKGKPRNEMLSDEICYTLRVTQALIEQ
jgi:hypothetical protein